MANPHLSPDELRALAPAEMENWRPDRYLGDGESVGLADFHALDATRVKLIYQRVDDVYQAWREDPGDPDWPAVEGAARRLQEASFLDAVDAFGGATRAGAAEGAPVRAVLHDVRGGALSAAVMEVELMEAREGSGPNASILQRLVYLARDHAKMMRNGVVDLDPDARAADLKEEPHDIGSLVRRWDGVAYAAPGKAAVVSAGTDRDGFLSSCCMEVSAVDRILYNHLNNALRHTTDRRIGVSFMHPARALVRIVVTNPVTPSDQRGLAETWDQDPLALYRIGGSTNGSGYGLHTAASFVASAFGLTSPTDAVRQGYLGSRLVGDVYAAWFHWPGFETEAASG